MKEKAAVVVGGTGQIGRCIIEALQREGYLAICVSAHPAAEKRDGVEYYVFDMSNQVHIEECYAAIAKKHDGINVLVNAIGKNKGNRLCEISEEIWDDVIDTNLKSVFFICRSFRGLLLTGSSIVNFASTAGIRALPRSPHYIAAKAGVIALTEYFAQIFAPDIRVNCIAPGFVATENHHQENYDGYIDAVGRIPLHKMATTAEIAEAVLYFASAETVTGHTLVIDGGLTLPR